MFEFLFVQLVAKNSVWGKFKRESVRVRVRVCGCVRVCVCGCECVEMCV